MVVVGVTTIRPRNIGQVVHNAVDCDRSELDSHADTCCAGDNSVVITRSGRYVDVSPFSSTYDALKSVEVVQAGTVWVNPTDGITYILVLNEALDLTGKLNKLLLNPNQIQCNGVTVEDCLEGNLTNHRHTCFTSAKKRFNLFLSLDGIISYLETRLPTQRELDD
jgi:hypothetical protein